MARDYIPVDRDQQFLIPPDIRDWLPENHLVWWLLDVVARLDTTLLHASRRRGAQGRAGYDPDMLLAVLIYSYCTKVRSSRQIERLCETDVAFRVICANRVPDHTTIARFRQEHARAARRLFAQVLELCAQAGLAQVGVVALDGTKIAANASRAANRDRRWLEGEIARMFDEAEETDRDEDDRYGPRRGDELPDELSDPKRRRARLEAALEQLDDGERGGRGETRTVRWERHLKVAEANLERARARWEETQARKDPHRSGRPPKYLEGVRVARQKARVANLKTRIASARPEAPSVTRINLTDPDSRLMTTKDGWVQGYNAQAAINHVGIIVAAEAFCEPTDKNLFVPMTTALSASEAVTGPVGIVLADAGYCSAKNLTAPGPTRLIATKSARKHRQDRSATSGPPPPDAGPTEAMTHTLRTPEGRQLYKQRSWTVEPGFGNLKANLGFTRFSRRGLAAAQGEWHLITAAANLLKLHRWHPAAIYST
jgi:transposase